jgi:hypothetical protein
LDTRRLPRAAGLSLDINHIKIALAGGQLTTHRGHQARHSLWRGNVTRPRAADDFATIRARMEELRQERAGAQTTDSDLQRDPPMPRARSLRWPLSEVGTGSGRVRQSGSGRG